MAKKQAPASKASAPSKKPVVHHHKVGAASAAAILGRPLAKPGGKAAPETQSWMPISRVKPEWQKFYQNLYHTPKMDW